MYCPLNSDQSCKQTIRDVVESKIVYANFSDRKMFTQVASENVYIDIISSYIHALCLLQKYLE